MKAIKKNLKDQIITDNKALMYCYVCGAENSANSGDYWSLPDNFVFKCCDTPMELVTKKTVITPI